MAKTHLRAFLFGFLSMCYSCHLKQNTRSTKTSDGTLTVTLSTKGIPEGIGYFYDNHGLKIAKYTYVNGTREGLAVNFYESGRVKDSVRYLDGKLNGIALHYDHQQRISVMSYYRSGLKIGPEILFDSNTHKAVEYQFKDSNQNVIVKAHYDVNENIDSISEFHMKLSIIKSSSEKVNKLFAYLPKMGSVNTTFSIGRSDAQHRDTLLTKIQNDEFLIDTVVPLCPNGYHYFLSCHVKSANKKINRMYIEDFIDTTR